MGYEPSAFAGLTITDLEAEPNPVETDAHVRAIRETGGDVFDRIHRKRSGEKVAVEIRVDGL